MRFKKGDKVEVMNRAEVPISWRAAEIVSGNGHTCSVRYGSGSPMQSENIKERVSRKMIRPCPPVVQCVETWAPGDIVEVYNDCSWKVAIMLSILPRDRYLVRLLGCSLELSIPISGMRDRQNWKDGKWIFIRKGCDQAGTQRSNKISAQDYNRKMKSQPLQLDAHTKVLGETDCLATEGKNRGQESCLISSRSLKRMSPYCTCGVDSLYGNAQKFQAIETDNRRQRAALVTLQEKVDAVAYPRGTLGEKYVHTSINIRSNGFNELKREDLGGVIGFSPRRSLEPSDSDNDACSVGSCSVTSERPNELLGHLPRVSRRVSGGLCSDAESFCGSGPSGYKEKSHNNPPEEELATSVHRLELHAYHCTLVALYAYGPLTWEKEALLTDLRITLHISNDEHLMELKNLIFSKGPKIEASSLASICIKMMLFAAIQVGIKWGYCKQLLSQKSWQISRITVLHGRFVVGRCRHVVNFVWYILYNFREDGAVAEGAFHLAEVPVDTSRDYSRYLFGLFAFCFVGHGLFKLVNKSLKLVNFTA